jgi:hypothetical protein
VTLAIVRQRMTLRQACARLDLFARRGDEARSAEEH